MLAGRLGKPSRKAFLLGVGPHYISFELRTCVFLVLGGGYNVVGGFEQEARLFGTLWIVIALQDPSQLPLAAHSRIRKPCCIRPLLQLQSLTVKGTLLSHYTLLFGDLLCT